MFILESIVEKIDQNKIELKMSDFWRPNGGYNDKLQVNMDEEMRFSGDELIPDDAKKPDRYDDRIIMWENTDASAPEKIRLMIFCTSRKG
jgi:hypothetical protein